MCSVSMIMDHYHDQWYKRLNPGPAITPWPFVFPVVPPVVPFVMPPSQQEIEEFRQLLERARQYDKDHGQPDCELEDKRRKIRELAKELCVDVEFV